MWTRMCRAFPQMNNASCRRAHRRTRRCPWHPAAAPRACGCRTHGRRIPVCAARRAAGAARADRAGRAPAAQSPGQPPRCTPARSRPARHTAQRRPRSRRWSRRRAARPAAPSQAARCLRRLAAGRPAGKWATTSARRRSHASTTVTRRVCRIAASGGRASQALRVCSRPSRRSWSCWRSGRESLPRSPGSAQRCKGSSRAGRPSSPSAPWSPWS
mmetsp:Transcript_105037/g.292565  ORF Transcript_105037/g.292565 Transcript_105037/m.292565 type:complete len:215 (-) Transcript_105037:1816-2460(-)